MRKVDEANAGARREVVLRAAIKCFAEIGLQKASIQDICKISGMRSGHIYYYFKSKAEIVEAAFALGLENLRERIENALFSGDIIDAIIGIHLDAESARRDWNITPSLRLEFTAETARNERLRRMETDMNNQVVAAIQTAAERAIKDHRLDPAFEPATFAYAMNLMWSGLAMLRVDENFDLHVYEKAVAAMLAPWIIGARPEGLDKVESAKPGKTTVPGADVRHASSVGHPKSKMRR